MRAKRIYGTVAERFWPKVEIRGADECWEWQAAIDTHGYGVFGHNTKAHRVSWTLTHGKIPAGMWVLHRCDNPPCCNPTHLWLGTQLDNVRDMIHKGRGRRPPPAPGQRNPNAKLSLAQVGEIRERYVRGESQRALSRSFGVCKSMIGNIVRGEAWK